MLERCDGPSCRLRAGDLGLGAADGRPVACLGRCDLPVAAQRDGRPLTIVARGRVEPWTAPPLPRQPAAPVLLRDAALPDQPTLVAARRRGAWEAWAHIVDYRRRPTSEEPGEAAAARALVALVGHGEPVAPGAFAGRVLCTRDPHLVLEGAAIVARAAQTADVAVCVPAQWSDARAALERAAAAARQAELVGDVALDRGIDPVTAARLARAAGAVDPRRRPASEVPADWWQRHATRLAAVSGDVVHPGVYELPDDATVADAVAAAGGAIDGVRAATAAYVLCDGVVTTDFGRPAPAALVVYGARRPPAP